MEDSKIYARILVNFLLTLITILLVVLLLPKMIRFFLPFVIAFFVSSIANPFVRFMEKKVKLARKHSSTIMILLVLGAVIGILYLAIWFIVKQAMNLYSDRFLIYDEMVAVFESFENNLAGVMGILPEELQESIDRWGDALTAGIENIITNIELPSIATAGSYVSNIVEMILIVIITILAAYFLTAERDKMGVLLKKYLPESITNYYQTVVGCFKKAIGGYFKAQFKIMVILTLIMFVGFEIMSINVSFLLALLIAFLDFLPVFGTGAVFWPWIVVDIVIGDYRQAIFLGIMYLVCQLVKQLLQPKMVGDSVGIHPLAALLYMFVGYRLGGVFGMIIGVPIGMIIVSLYQAGLFDTQIRGIKILAKAINDFRKY